MSLCPKHRSIDAHPHWARQGRDLQPPPTPPLILCTPTALRLCPQKSQKAKCRMLEEAEEDARGGLYTDEETGLEAIGAQCATQLNALRALQVQV